MIYFLGFKDEDYPGTIPHSDPTVREVDDRFFISIHKSLLHYVATREPMFPCLEAIEWIIDRTLVDRGMLIDGPRN
jgi:hypothetical protein